MAVPRFVALEVHGDFDTEVVDVTGPQAARIPYVKAALQKEWRAGSRGELETVQVGQETLKKQGKQSENE